MQMEKTIGDWKGGIKNMFLGVPRTVLMFYQYWARPKNYERGWA